jgi:hypothetical protein
MLIHVDLDPEEEEKECLEYIAMIVESKIELSRACSSEDLKKHKEVLEAPGLKPVAAEGPPALRNRKLQVTIEDEAENLSPEPTLASSIQREALVVEASIVEASTVDKAAFLPHYRMNSNRHRYEPSQNRPRSRTRGKR